MNELEKSPICYTYFRSPVGWILLAGTARGICLLHFCGRERLPESATHEYLQNNCPADGPKQATAPTMLLSTRHILECYFAEQIPPAAVPLDLRQGTPFQQKVWQALNTIPFGETRSYGQIAAAIGQRRASRAVGQACGRNPVPILVPCHRVLAAGGKPGGYGSGLHIKRALLELEGIVLAT